MNLLSGARRCEYSETHIEILDSLLAIDVLKAIRTSKNYADTFMLYSDPELTKKAAAAFVDRFGEDYAGIIATREFAMPLAMNISMEYRQRGKRVTPYLLESEYQGGINPMFEANGNRKVVVVRDLIQSGSHIQEVLDHHIPEIGAEPSVVLTILDNDAEPQRRFLAEVLEKYSPEVRMVALTRASR